LQTRLESNDICRCSHDASQVKKEESTRQSVAGRKTRKAERLVCSCISLTILSRRVFDNRYTVAKTVIWVMIIGSYMDESFDYKQTGTFVVGGILGRGVPIFELERRWEKLLRRPDIDIPYFKASECHNGLGPFAKFVSDPKSITATERKRLDSISHEFLSLIANPVAYDEKHYLCVHGAGVIQEDFYDVIKDDNARAILGPSPYRLAYNFAMINCAWAMKELGDGGTGYGVSFICDEHEQYSPHAQEAFQNLKATNPNAGQYMTTFASADEKDCAPLQAADAGVFEVRRALNLALKKRDGELRSQFSLLADASAMFLITHSNKEQLEHLVANHEPGEPYRLDSLMEMNLGENIKLEI
jgi:hypothetical protein